MPDLRLRPLRAADEPAARVAHDELADDDFMFLLDWDPSAPWTEYITMLERRRLGRDLPSDRVRAAFLVAMVGDDLVGRVSIRFTLNEYLEQFGGHIGYGVRPAFRRRGHATTMLRQALVIARAEGVDPVLVTCDEDNASSAKVIESAGGVYEDSRFDRTDGTAKRRYWIA